MARTPVGRAAAAADLHLGCARFLQSFDETLDGGLILPRGLYGMVASLAGEAGSRLEVTDERAKGMAQEFTFGATLTAEQKEAATELAEHDLGARRAPTDAIMCYVGVLSSAEAVVSAEGSVLGTRGRCRVGSFHCLWFEDRVHDLCSGGEDGA
jgi:hypothetical protein